MVSANIPDPLTYKGNINPTTEDGGADAIPTGSPGDAYTCSWGGTNVEGDLDNSPTLVECNQRHRYNRNPWVIFASSTAVTAATQTNGPW